MVEVEFKKIDGTSPGYYLVLLILTIFTLWGVYAWYLQLVYGHCVTGLSQRVPWGFGTAAICYLIGASAGSLIVSALSGVFGKEEFKIFSRSACLFALAMIVAAMLSIMQDIGNPENGLNVLAHFNFTSIFSWNAFLYSSYFVIGFIYLMAQFEEKKFLTKCLAVLAVAWAVLVHSGTGGIVGFVYSTELYHSSLTIPLFIVSAIVSGLGLLIPAYILAFRWTHRPLDRDLMWTLAKIMGALTILLLYCFAAEILDCAYVPGNQEAIRIYLFDFHYPYAWVFWFVQILGCILTVAILLSPWGKTDWGMIAAGLIVAVAVYGERYTLITPGLGIPKDYVPGMIFKPYIVVPYYPAWTEYAMFIGLVTAAYLAWCIGLKIFAVLPERGEVVKK